jgi:hypothetical protein
MARLVVNPGSPGAWEIQLKPGANALGRGSANDFTLSDPSVSTSHCQITVGTDGAVIIKDLGSSNGTFVDRTPVQEAFLQNGQTVQLGGMPMMFVGDGAAPAVPIAVALPVSSAVPTSPPATLARMPLKVTLASSHAPHNEAPAAPAVPPPVPPPVPGAQRRLPAAVPAAKATCDKKPNFGLGVLGALAGAVVGGLIYFLIFHFTGLRFKIIAIGVGYLAGLGAELLGRKEGSKELGMIAAMLALSGILGAQYLVVRGWWNEGERTRTKTRESAYSEAVAEAKKVLAAIPNGTDQEIRVYLAKEAADEGEKPDVNAVTAEEVKTFKETTLSEMRQLADGKITKAEYDQKNGYDEASAKEEKAVDESTFKAFFLLFLLSRLNIFSTIAAAALAFKVCANA